MSRKNQQIARLIQELVRGVQTGKIRLRWLIAIAVLVGGYFLLQPMLERSLGVDLPGLGDVVADSSPAPNEEASPRSTNQSKTPPTTDRSAARSVPSGELDAILNSETRRVYTSPAGLRYTGGSLQGHRLKHVMAHTYDQPQRSGPHGVFDTDDPAEVVAIVDEAYLQAQTGRDTRTQREEERTVYDVNLRRRIGYVGGTSGNRRNNPVAKHLRIVIDGDRLITAFPVIP